MMDKLSVYVSRTSRRKTLYSLAYNFGRKLHFYFHYNDMTRKFSYEFKFDPEENLLDYVCGVDVLSSYVDNYVAKLSTSFGANDMPCCEDCEDTTRSGVNLMNVYNMKRLVPNSLSDLIKEYSTNYVTETIKYKFGFEIAKNKYILNIDDSENYIKRYFVKIIPGFIQKVYEYDGKVAKQDFIVFHKIDSGTFIYITSGIYTANLLKKKMLDPDRSSTGAVCIYVFGKHSPKYANRIKKLIEKTDNNNSSHLIYTVTKLSGIVSNSQVTCFELTHRDVGTMFYSNNELSILIKFIDRYELNEDYYNKLELSYKTGILLYGTPGGGKSSLVKVIATKYRRDIVQVDVTKLQDIDLSLLANLINNDTDKKYIVLFEDVDAMMLDRSELNQNNETAKVYKDNINRLLQFLDSAISPKNVIFIATTNHLDKLGPALIRDGRFDLKLEVKGLAPENIPAFMKKLECTASVDEVLDMYGKSDPDGTYNQSKLQNIIINLRDNRNVSSIIER